jgi:hypothetical protein
VTGNFRKSKQANGGWIPSLELEDLQAIVAEKENKQRQRMERIEREVLNEIGRSQGNGEDICTVLKKMFGVIQDETES